LRDVPIDVRAWIGDLLDEVLLLQEIEFLFDL
jgi:hypothetical protein